MTQERQIQVSTNAQLSTTLLQFSEVAQQSARRNVATYIEATGSTFTATEKQALVKMEQLKLYGGLSLAELLLRGEMILEIEREGLWSQHPRGYASMEEAAEDQGITKSEYSNVRDLVQTIFPYLNSAGYNIADLWESIGKSKFRELIPIFKRAILNEPSTSQRVEESFTNAMNDIFATARATGQPITNEEARVQFLDQLVEVGHLPVREMRQHIRPERTPSMEAFALPVRNNRQVIMVVVDTDQRELFNRRLTGYIDVSNVTQADVRRSPIFQDLAQYLNGN